MHGRCIGCWFVKVFAVGLFHLFTPEYKWVPWKNMWGNLRGGLGHDKHF